MKRFYGGIISGSTNVTGSGFLTAATVQLQPASSTTMNATGGTISYSGNYKIHTFTTSGTFTVLSGVNYMVEYLCIGGGAGGCGSNTNGVSGGGGGGGGFLEYTVGSYDGADFTGYRMVVNKDESYTVTVGAGGVGDQNGHGAMGGTSSITSATRNCVVTLGGGGGGAASNTYAASHGGANGGGNWHSSRENIIVTLGGINYSPRQGYSFDNVLYGAGAGATGTTQATRIAGRVSSITGGTYGAGGICTNTSPPAGAANTGNAGSGVNVYSTTIVASAGGSGIVVIRYKYQ